MSYYLLLKLKGVKYTGDNLGRELKIVLQIEKQTAEINIALPRGSSKSFDKIIFQRTLKKKALTLPIIAEVREIRERHVDFGAGKTSIKIKEGTVQKEIKVSIKGVGREKGKIAIITFDLEISYESTIRYVSDVKSKGWLKVKLENKEVIALPQLLKVELLRVEDNREYFVVLEGAFKRKNANVCLNEEGKSYLSRKGAHRGSAKLFLDQNAGKLTVLGLGTYNAVVDKNDPIPFGKYDLEIPSEPHDLGRYYLEYSRYAKTWFRISHKGARFLHVGSRSAGCITVTDKAKWTEIYAFLIKSRKDAYNVGEVIVR
ncbi:hypothetical protein A2276_01675 [candidate division WOR-1 bacterium RIFOXYA12_FULL_43_27]|uniref:Uncharacterized protein n=1 Tax=candidate division WOR-1 bacterium RIFOXYC2_FULL_46_14 TaxID=1802587 RepID=A0A1F4U725_UNCSA|nr:MAG: hypothetical protein A2276_01675 [candidate division WOR-1 bacterium RIFOXYA12_FULL_43_27]OGC19565.1 MAG: hypothetical protein A2292_02655 [candidate division WOR-1 bacterium RIFOXYB2_FULL_46_45]OGC30553.1 MAG: hypothetical protein A2232_02655 [candidate division WOR-1 bacterium RIFOXYA2_FULL_46_56]OGC40620.1 MAG: hypothetical protein A2438_06370 [candidate division WOR-1 bacterium RIFOXYC2_FULL_46_14]